MKNYFNLTIEEKKALAAKRDFTPAHFAKEKPEEVVEETIEDVPVEESSTTEEPVVSKKSKKSKK